MRTALNVTIHSFIPILLGGLIYILFRPSTLRMFQWFDLFGINELIKHVRNHIVSYGIIVPDWLIYSIPDGLWIYSFTSTLIIVNNCEWSKYKHWLLLPVSLGIGVELLQYFGLFKGTFDVYDLWCYVIGMLLSISFFNYK